MIFVSADIPFCMLRNDPSAPGNNTFVPLASFANSAATSAVSMPLADIAGKIALKAQHFFRSGAHYAKFYILWQLRI